MESPKKNNKTLIIFITLAVLIIARVMLSIFTNSTKENETQKEKEIQQSTTLDLSDQNAINETIPENSALTPDDSSSQQALAQMEANCAEIKGQYANLNEVKKNHKIENLFFNIHKEIDGKIFRLRFFFKDGENSEIPTYLVYEEDINEEELIIENTSHQKGPLYKKIESAKGEILFTGSAYDMPGELDLFLYYENNILKDLQGDVNLPGIGLTHLECRY